MKKLVNFNEVVQDKIHHLWIKISSANNSLISFRDYKCGLRELSTITEEIMNFSGDNKLRLLELFEKLKWINLEKGYDRNFSFSFRINQNNNVEKKLLINILRKYGTLNNKGESYILE
jgi:hypothetical protein